MDLYKTDGEFLGIAEHFANVEVKEDEDVKLDDRTRYLAILACSMGAMGKEEFKVVLDEALSKGVDPVAIKEVVYQSVDYLGLARTREFLEITNDIMINHKIHLPLASQKTVTCEDRFEKGLEKQVSFFGPQMKENVNKSIINRWLAANCFGDYYTRSGLSDREREMITFCFLLAQGGCEAQLMGHSLGNFNVGNDKDFMMRVILNLVPYIGYPRSLNAINILNKVAESVSK